MTIENKIKKDNKYRYTTEKQKDPSNGGTPSKEDLSKKEKKHSSQNYGEVHKKTRRTTVVKNKG